ncbi:unnamed protein product [Caenorhabditis brenneri]
MNSVFLFSLVFFLYSTCKCCTYTNTWVILENLDDRDSATFPTVDYQNDTFCVTTKDMQNGKVFYSNLQLTNPIEASYFEQLSYSSFDKQSSTCTTTNPSVKGCISHCQDKKLENTVILASIASTEPKDIVQQISKNVDSPLSTVIISAYINPGDANQMVSYDYYDDTTFCSVFVKVKNNLQFPYGIMTTVQKVL